MLIESSDKELNLGRVETGIGGQFTTHEGGGRPLLGYDGRAYVAFYAGLARKTERTGSAPDLKGTGLAKTTRLDSQEWLETKTF